MIKLLIIADDFTGALDTGVQFACKGVRTVVTVDGKVDFQADELSQATVVVANAESRHLSREDAYRCVYGIAAKAAEVGVRCFYKKMDSALRGNIGAELEALMDATGENTLVAAPAFPGIGRVTRNGCQYIEEAPVTQSLIGQDPFNRVLHDEVAEIIGEQSAVRVQTRDPGQELPVSPDKTIYVCNVEKDEDFLDALEWSHQNGINRLLAGCAGFARFLPLLERHPAGDIGRIKTKRGMLAVSGSMFPLSFQQIDHFERTSRLSVIRLSREERLCGDPLHDPRILAKLELARRQYQSGGICLLDMARDEDDADRSATVESEAEKLDMSACIAQNTGTMVARLWERCPDATLVVFGGDTLQSVMRSMKARYLEPELEIGKGVVCSTAYLPTGATPIITKAGAFGSIDILTQIHEFILYNSKEGNVG